MNNKDLKLTSVKIIESLYHRFKLETLDTKMTLQKITNRSVRMYLSDEDFRKTINNYSELAISGSNF
jgi:hypothetical protein